VIARQLQCSMPWWLKPEHFGRRSLEVVGNPFTPTVAAWRAALPTPYRNDVVVRGLADILLEPTLLN